MSARHRRSKLPLRLGIILAAGRAWNGVHRAWRRRLRSAMSVWRRAYGSTYEMIDMPPVRGDRLDDAIEAMMSTSAFMPVVVRLGCCAAI